MLKVLVLRKNRVNQQHETFQRMLGYGKIIQTKGKIFKGPGERKS